jgi:Flp pilus assembly secretin CpaC
MHAVEIGFFVLLHMFSSSALAAPEVGEDGRVACCAGELKEANHWCGATDSSPQSVTELELRVGETVELPRGEFKRVAIGDPSIADVRVRSPKDVTVVALKPGRTTVITWTTAQVRRDFAIQVKP